MNDKKIQVWLPLFLSVSLIIGMFFGYKLKDNMGAYGPSFFGKSQKTSLQEILDLVKQKYVDTVNVDSLGLFAIQDVLSQLDPHSIYIPPKELRTVNEEMQGSFEGVGIEFDLIRDTVFVLNVVHDGPAFKTGLQIGDKLISANDSLLSGVKRGEKSIVSIFRGAKGTEVFVKLLRNQQLKEFTIQRGIIPLKSVEAAYLIEPEVAYIRLNRFASSTYEEFMENLERLKKEGMKKLILDLRGNGGGMLDDAVQIADEFIDGNKEIVYTEGKSTPKQIYSSRRPGLFENGNLVLLIDEGSASASEVLAGALQDWDRATIIGRRSFGKGLVQEQFQLNDGSAVRLTVSRYYTPIGRSIQKPYDKNNHEKYMEEVNDRYKNGELFHNDSAIHNGKVYKTKNGRTVYGGGGISPDIYIPVDSNTTIPNTIKENIKETLHEVVFNYYLQHQSKLKALKSPSELIKDLSITTELWQVFRAKLAEKGIQTNTYSLLVQNEIKEYLHSMLSRYIWHTLGYIQMMNMNDPMIKRALEEIKK